MGQFQIQRCSSGPPEAKAGLSTMPCASLLQSGVQAGHQSQSIVILFTSTLRMSCPAGCASILHVSQACVSSDCNVHDGLLGGPVILGVERAGNSWGALRRECQLRAHCSRTSRSTQCLHLALNSCSGSQLGREHLFLVWGVR